MIRRRRPPPPDAVVWEALRRIVERDVQQLVAAGWSNADTLTLIVDASTHRLVKVLAASVRQMPDVTE